MTRKFIMASGLLVSFLLALTLVLAFRNVLVQSEVFYNWLVDDDGKADFISIQGAINAAETGDVILVKAGTYFENVVIDKSALQVFGEKDSIIQGKVDITADQALFAGFIINGDPESNGIILNNVDDCVISNNSISNINIGISLFLEPESEDYEFGGNSITGNFLSENNVGILSNTVYGMWDYPVIYGNNFIGNYLVKNNYGILITSDFNIPAVNKVYDGNLISANIMSENLHGFYFNCSIGILNLNDGESFVFGENSLIGNNLTSNNCAIEVYCEDIGILSTYGFVSLLFGKNKIYHNNFIENGKIRQSGIKYIGNWNMDGFENKNITAGIEQWDNEYPSGGNYWSEYVGNDTDVDGIGDTAYIIDFQNRDRYPLVTSVSIEPAEIPETPEYPVPTPTPTSSPTSSPSIAPTDSPTSTLAPTSTPTPTLSPQFSPTPQPTPTPEPKPGLFLPIEALIAIGGITTVAIIVIVLIVLRKRK